MIWIVTDTAQENLQDTEKGLMVVNLPVSVNGNVCEKPLEKEEFYTLLEDDAITLQTSQASPAVFEELFGRLTENGDEVLGIFLSSTLSGTFNSARLAAQDLRGVYLVDSRNACLGQSALVQRALQLRETAADAAQLKDLVEAEVSQCRLLAAVPSLKYLKKGGRLPAAVAIAGDLMGIKPLVTVDEKGEVAVDSKVRGLKKAIRSVAKRALEMGLDPERPIVVGFSGLSDDNARALQHELEKEAGITLDGKLYPLSNVLAVHAGPDAAGIGFFCKEEQN